MSFKCHTCVIQVSHLCHSSVTPVSFKWHFQISFSNFRSVIDGEPLRFRGEVYHPYHFNCTGCSKELTSSAIEVKTRPGYTANELVGSLLGFRKSWKINGIFKILAFTIFWPGARVKSLGGQDPQSAGINLQSSRSDSTPWTLTLVWVHFYKILVPYFREYFPRKLFFFEFNLMYCDLWWQ